MVLQSSQGGDSHCVRRKGGLIITSVWRLPLCVEEGGSYNHLSVETFTMCGGRLVLQSSKCGDFHCVGEGVGRGWWVNGLTIISVWRLQLCVKQGWSYNRPKICCHIHLFAMLLEKPNIALGTIF